jgi:hypothetical protein
MSKFNLTIRGDVHTEQKQPTTENRQTVVDVDYVIIM